MIENYEQTFNLIPDMTNCVFFLSKVIESDEVKMCVCRKILVNMDIEDPAGCESSKKNQGDSNGNEDFDENEFIFSKFSKLIVNINQLYRKF
jgi:hypothetical protein